MRRGGASIMGLRLSPKMTPKHKVTTTNILVKEKEKNSSHSNCMESGWASNTACRVHYESLKWCAPHLQQTRSRCAIINHCSVWGYPDSTTFMLSKPRLVWLISLTIDSTEAFYHHSIWWYSLMKFLSTEYSHSSPLLIICFLSCQI